MATTEPSNRRSRPLLPHEASDLLEANGVRVAPVHLVGMDAGIEVIEALDLTYPVAVKIAAAEIAHKAKYGGVVLGCQDPGAVLEAKTTIERDVTRAMAARGEDHVVLGVYVQPMLLGDLEVLLGIQRDPDFGPLVAFGLGGWAVEVWEDLSFRRPPLTDRDVDSLLSSTRAGALLSSTPDRFGRAIADLRRGIEGMSRLAIELADTLIELEANPMLVNASGAFAVDAVGLIATSSTDGQTTPEPHEGERDA